MVIVLVIAILEMALEIGEIGVETEAIEVEKAEVSSVLDWLGVGELDEKLDNLPVDERGRPPNKGDSD